MKKKEIADWLLNYYLIGTVLIGLILIILGPQKSLLSLNDSSGIFAIIIPLFLGQLATLFQWRLTNTTNEDIEKEVNFPRKWVKRPAIISFGIFILAVVLRGISTTKDWGINLSEEQFKYLTVFCISILNITTIVLTANLFKGTK